ncbi:MAG: hypothetical protein KJZ70_03995 [Bryobacterales bacterium]|nr:hypothetical protein [Bryobacterales bacterium]
MMKLVQIGILAALVLVAVLLGLNLINDRGTPPAEPAPAVASPVPPATAEADATSASVPPVSGTATAAPQPAAGTADTAKTASDQRSAAQHSATAPKPTVTTQSGSTAKTTASRPAASKPSPTAAPGSAHTTPATPPAEHREVARVDPPSAMPEAHPAPAPAAPETSRTERYELMRPDSTPVHPANSHVAPPRTVTIPAGTILTIRTIQALSSKSNSVGDTFSGTLDQPMVVDDMVIAERGSRVEGKVAEVTESGRVKGIAQIAIVLTKINTSDGQTVEIGTQHFVVEAEKTTKSDATKVGIATGIGAALGAIFGGGKGAAIGAATGGAAGAGTVLVTKGKPAEIPSETRINFRLDRPLVITEKINSK